MTALRQRLIEEITLRGYSPRTTEAYVHAVAELARYYHRAPDRLTDPEVRAYLLHLHLETGKAASTLNVTCTGKKAQDAGYATMFVERVAALPGMIKCAVLSQDFAARNMTFRMVYFADKFPDGVNTRLLAMPELHLKPLAAKGDAEMNGEVR